MDTIRWLKFLNIEGARESLFCHAKHRWMLIAAPSSAPALARINTSDFRIFDEFHRKPLMVAIPISKDDIHAGLTLGGITTVQLPNSATVRHKFLETLQAPVTHLMHGNSLTMGNGNDVFVIAKPLEEALRQSASRRSDQERAKVGANLFGCLCLRGKQAVYSSDKLRIG